MSKITSIPVGRRGTKIAEKVVRTNFAEIPFKGFHKFRKEHFDYRPEHILLPESLFHDGAFVPAFDSFFTVGICGTTSPAPSAEKVTKLLSAWTVGFPSERKSAVISGGVLGIDTAAHLGAIEGKGCTFAVVANCVEMGLHPYVPKRKELETQVRQYGGILSEYSDYLEDRSERLLQRDRIISGLSDLLIVTQAKSGSASVDTAKRAFLQGVKVIAIDWRKLAPGVLAPLDYGGNDELFDLKIAAPFPDRAIDRLDHPHLKEDFRKVLRATMDGYRF